MKDCFLVLPVNIHFIFFQFPGITSFVVQQPRVIVALVEILQDAGKDLWLLIRQSYPFCMGFEELSSAAGGKEWRDTKHVFMGREQTLLPAHADRDD